MIYHYKGFPIPMMLLKFFYDISIMFHIDAMTDMAIQQDGIG
jgi:hypothetical protein